MLVSSHMALPLCVPENTSLRTFVVLGNASLFQVLLWVLPERGNEIV